jgi:hypothetical protein
LASSQSSSLATGSLACPNGRSFKSRQWRNAFSPLGLISLICYQRVSLCLCNVRTWSERTVNCGLGPPSETGIADRGIPPSLETDSHSKALGCSPNFLFFGRCG